MILAPLRGVTIRCFRATFSHEIAEAGFTEAITPFITANAGVNPLKDRELGRGEEIPSIKVTPQFIGKDPDALKFCLEKIREKGYDTADLNAGCPFPMVRNKGRGSGLLKNPKLLAEMMSVGVSIMGEGRFSVKTRLGIDSPNELKALMPLINDFPLRYLTVHARTAKEMYCGNVHLEEFKEIASNAKVPLIYNGDAPIDDFDWPKEYLMIGRSFIRSLGERENSNELVEKYIENSLKELGSPRAVLGRMKELASYWKELPRYRRLWPIVKLARTLDEFRIALNL